VEAFGADSLRIYLMFMGPFDYTMAWNQDSLEGSYRFLKRVWQLVNSLQQTAYSKQQSAISDKPILRKLNQTIKKVGEDIGNMKFNTAIAALMEFLNEINKTYGINETHKSNKKILEKFLLILAPFAPHITEELWERLGNKFSIHQQRWPEYDPGVIEEEVTTVAIQVNGKLRGTIEVQSSKFPPSLKLRRAGKIQSEVEELAKENEKIKKYLEGKEIKRTIYVPGKLINFVV